MKYKTLVARVRKAAKAKDVPFEMRRQKGSHQVWTCGATPVTIPKHKEINEITAESICKALETELGEKWWR
ncbi:type II toxin-antitoxin system HicA family toxin [Streptomyces xinghaiensis]|uniref:type II toxin-antitoxin system HicA family toxin n=1 Tax=Streptomyces xinghaiensis TaxID=1038928 RepID=UPI0002F654CD|nr:type II toxin-antitoxin system HicA family toxin [Streptomyces xinghaiensis]MZE75923.1 addiction module toxin, HicA family [Streptomyces sp. SID5475]